MRGLIQVFRAWVLIVIAAAACVCAGHDSFAGWVGSARAQQDEPAPLPRDSTFAEVLDLSTWAGEGPALPPLNDVTELSLRFLEWRHLARWTRAELVGGENPQAAVYWAAVRRIRLEDRQAAPWAQRHRERAQCLYEEERPSRATMIALCDSLDSGRFDAGRLLVEGLLQACLLERRGADLCPSREDPALALASTLDGPGDIPLKQLKEGADFASLYFAAEREVQRAQSLRLERVEDFLAQSGQHIALKYGHRRIKSLEAPIDAERIGDAHWVYPKGVVVDWGKGRHLRVRDLPVLHQPEQHLFQVVVPGPAPTLRQGDESLRLEYGEFKLAGAYKLRSSFVDLDLDGGRYRRDETELRLWLPDGFLETNRSGLFMALLVAVVTAYLFVLNRRKRRELDRPLEFQRPRPPL